MASTEITITSVFDFFPNLRKKAKTRYLTIIGIVIVYFLLGILYTIQSGTYWIGLELNIIEFSSMFQLTIMIINLRNR